MCVYIFGSWVVGSTHINKLLLQPTKVLPKTSGGEQNYTVSCTLVERYDVEERAVDRHFWGIYRAWNGDDVCGSRDPDIRCNVMRRD